MILSMLLLLVAFALWWYAMTCWYDGNEAESAAFFALAIFAVLVAVTRLA